MHVNYCSSPAFLMIPLEIKSCFEVREYPNATCTCNIICGKNINNCPNHTHSPAKCGHVFCEADAKSLGVLQPMKQTIDILMIYTLIISDDILTFLGSLSTQDRHCFEEVTSLPTLVYMTRIIITL